MRLGLEPPENLSTDCEEILCITQDGTRAKPEFSTENLFPRWYYSSHSFQLSSGSYLPRRSKAPSEEHLLELKLVARYFGFRPETIDSLLEDGFTTDDIEKMFYCGSFY